MKISIVTPTYNRAHLLQRCYDSLCRQTMQDFEWIVVDDGSADHTEEVVHNFINEDKISIRYIRQNNAGKHSAHNTGAENAHGELFVCLDSDDYFPDCALEHAWRFWEDNQAENIIGLIAKRRDESGNPLCSEFPDGIDSLTMYDFSNKYGITGDTVLFFRAELMKKVKFPVFTGERFIPETALYFELDQYGKMLLCSEMLYVGEYQSDGLTSKYHSLLLKNPVGTAYCYYKSFQCAESVKDKLKYAILTMGYWRKSCNQYFTIPAWMVLFYPAGRFYLKKKIIPITNNGSEL